MMKDYLSNKKVKKWIAFLMAIVMVFLAIPNYPAEAADAVPLDVKDYKGDRAQTEWAVPTQTGKVFAGWYTDDTYSTIYTKTTGTAYPKFVDAGVLTVKKQLKAKTTSASKTTDIRFITSIDTANFSYVGFEVEVDCEPVIKFDLQERTAYSSIIADGQTISNAAKVFGTDESVYFVTHTITGVPNAVFDNTFTVKPYWYTLDGTKVYGTTRSFAINDELLEDSLVAKKVTVNGKTIDMSDVVNYVGGEGGTTASLDGYYNYHLVKKTVTNRCNTNRSMTGSTRKVLYLNRVLTDSFVFETTINMSSLNDKTRSDYARQGIVLSDGTVELAIFPAKWTNSNNTQDDTILSGTGCWWISNGMQSELVTDVGLHDGVGKCITKNYASAITLKVVKVGNTHINLYVNDKLITVLKADGLYKPDGTKSAKTQFDSDLRALFTSEELIVGLNHYNSLSNPNIVYSDIKFDEGVVSDTVEVNDTTFDMSDVIKYIDGDEAPANGYYNYHLTNKTVTNLCDGVHSIAKKTRKVLYLNRVMKGSFTFETTIDMSSLNDYTNHAYARQGIVLSNGTVQFAIFPAKWASSATSSTITSGSGYWWMSNGTDSMLVDDAGMHDGVGKCVTQNYADTITLKVEKIGNRQINLYANDKLVTILKADGIYHGQTNAKSVDAGTTYNQNIKDLLASEEMVIGLNHYTDLRHPNIVYSDIEFEEIELEDSLVTDKVTVNGTTLGMSDVIKYIDGNEEPVAGYYNYHLTNKTVTNLCTVDHSIDYPATTRKVLYLNKVLTGSFTFETTIDMSSLDDKKRSDYARQGIVLSNGTTELAIFPATWTSGNNQDDTIQPTDEKGVGTGGWYVHNGDKTNATFITDAGTHTGVGKCVTTNYASTITLKVEKVGNTHINLYANDTLITALKPDGFYNADGTSKSKVTAFNNDLAALFASEEMVIGLNHYSQLTKPNIVYKNIRFNYAETVYLSSVNGNDENRGTENAPIATLEKALDVVSDGGTIVVCDFYSASADFKWKEQDKTVTIIGDSDIDTEKLSFVNVSDNVVIGNHVTFDQITLDFVEDTNLFANGYKLVIGENVTTTNPINLYGGGNKTAVESTDIVVKSGNYHKIYGGSYVGAVEGDTHVYVGGTTNAAARVTSHSHTYDIYGGGYYDTVRGTAYLTFTDEAKANYVYGGCYGTGTLKATDVVFSGGTAMSLYGGNISYDGVRSVKVQMTGGEIEQLFGANENVNMTGNVMLELTGGKITRRVYGGCYNETSSSGVWSTACYVSGTIDLKIGGGVDISAAYNVDRGIYACSRYGSVYDGEKCTVTFMDVTAYAKYASKMGSWDSTMKSIMSGVDSSVTSETKYYDLVLADKDSLVANKVTVNGNVFDMSKVIKYIDGDTTPVNGYYNYHVTNKTVTNLCNNKHSITDATHKVLYLNKVFTDSFTFETKIDMSSLDDITKAACARQGIVLSNGTVELAIFPAKWTNSDDTQDNSILSGTGRWYVHNGTTGAFIDANAGTHDGVGKCVSTEYASEIILKVEKNGNTHINLYANNKLITVLKADGFYSADGTQKATQTTFNEDLSALLTSEEMIIGLNHYNALDFPNIVYKDIKMDNVE